VKLFKPKEDAPALPFFHGGKHTIRFFDDEERQIQKYEGCTHVTAEHYIVWFVDEFGLRHMRSGCGYSVEEEIP
jgi:hypothetical protein